MAYTKIPFDETILANPANEETNALPYWIEACAYLFNLIIGDPDLSRLPICDQLHALLSFWRTKRLSAARADLEDAALDLSYFGPVGKAVWYVTDKKDSQFKRELTRFATDAASAVGNHYLFYIVATLAANGYKVGFVPEAGKQNRKTPDLWADKNGKRISGMIPRVFGPEIEVVEALRHGVDTVVLQLRVQNLSQISLQALGAKPFDVVGNDCLFFLQFYA
jgi:hypothetical protein